MADFTNKQLAEIISATSEEIKKSVLNQRKIANELSETEKSLGEKITKLESVSLEPNLKHCMSSKESVLFLRECFLFQI